MTTPAGWYPDPNGQTRWWDGYRWTETVQPAPQPWTPPAPVRVPAGTPTSTVWIWLIVLLPVLTLIPTIGYLASLQSKVLETIAMVPITPDGSVPEGMLNQQFSVIFDPWYLALVLVGLVVTALVIWFAYLDRRELARMGYGRTFSWGWAFLGIVYPIGRSVVVRRQAGRGLAPMWVAIGVQACALVVTVIWTVSFMTTIFGAIYDKVGIM